MKQLLKILIYTCLLGFLFLLSILFIPRSYKVAQFTERPNTEYWKLSTGSTIGYQKLAATTTSNNAPIIYLHGGPGGIITDQTIAMLRTLTTYGFDVYLYDQLGSGHSSRLDNIEGYTVERHRQDLAAIIEKIQAEKVILFGQSWGALLAMEFLADHPDKVEKLVFTGPGPILPINSALSKKQSPDSLNLKTPKFSNQEGNRKAYNLRAKFLQYCAVTFGKKMSSDQEADNFFTYLNNELKKSTQCDPINIEPAGGGGGYYAHVMTVKSFRYTKDKRHKIKGLTIPTLIIKGQCDNQKWGFAEEYLQLLPNAELKIIEGAGHVVDEEHQEVYIETIRTFLNKENLR
ncbi:MAG: alpha/beta hydrolase [Bacteroidota bacterium]